MPRCQMCGDYEPQYCCTAQSLTRLNMDTRFMLCQECLQQIMEPPKEETGEPRDYFFCEEGTALAAITTDREVKGQNYYPVLYAAMGEGGLLRSKPDEIPVFADIPSLRGWWLSRGKITGGVIALDPAVARQYTEGPLFKFYKGE